MPGYCLRAPGRGEPWASQRLAREQIPLASLISWQPSSWELGHGAASARAYRRWTTPPASRTCPAEVAAERVAGTPRATSDWSRVPGEPPHSSMWSQGPLSAHSSSPTASRRRPARRPPAAPPDHGALMLPAERVDSRLMGVASPWTQVGPG
jgi:hypothetical protein